MTQNDIRFILSELSRERRLFWAEADFQFAFAWKLKELFPDAEIRLERKHTLPEQNGKTKPAYVDIWVTLDGKVYPIELKYKTRKYSGADIKGEVIETTGQGAWDIGRQKYLKDIERIEGFSGREDFGRGFAIMITNDRHYYDAALAPSGTTDRDFLIHEGQVVSGNQDLVWHSDKKWATSLGNVRLKKDYTMLWREYSKCLDGKGDFKYVLSEI